MVRKKESQKHTYVQEGSNKRTRCSRLQGVVEAESDTCPPCSDTYLNPTDGVPVFPCLPPATGTVAADEVVKGSSPAFFKKVLQSVVKLFVTSTSPNYAMPWQMKYQTKSTASGFVIAGRRIITNAHAVSHQMLIMVRKHGHARKYIARVLACGAECDLALLTVNEEEFWEDIEHLELGDVPHLQEVVTVVGYPTGGDSVSVTKGVVSRLNLQQYSHASFHLLAIQIDAAINAGNSGGPALQGEKVAGVAFETLLDAENIGYIIPVPVIEHFLRDVDSSKKYRGFCDIGFFWQEMENTDFKAHMKMKPGQSGIYVTRVQPLAKVNKVIRPGDVILAFDGVPLADDGTVCFREKELIDFSHLVSMKFVEESCTLTLLRDGQQMDVVTPLDMNKQLVPIHLYNLDGPPPYFIYAGLVFLVCSQPLLRAQYGKDWECKGPIQLCEKAAHGMMESEGQELVLLSQVLAHEVNTGYQNLTNVEVLAVNGVKVHDLCHLAKMLLTNTDEYVKIDVEKHKTIVLSVQRAIAAQDEILAQHCIPTSCPAGFLEAAGIPVVNGKTPGNAPSDSSKLGRKAATKRQ